MDTIDKLIKSLQEAKAELQKSPNETNGSNDPNMAKDDIVRPDKGYGKVTIKGATLPKPKDTTKPFGRVILKEELSCSENGQWNLLEKDAVNPKLAPKDVKVKALQTQVDAGTYKPDAGKIAGAMLAHPEKPIKKEEEE